MRERKMAVAVLLASLVLGVSCAPGAHEELEPLRGPGGEVIAAGGDSNGSSSDPAAGGGDRQLRVEDLTLELPPWPELDVELLDRGAEPHRVLQFDPQPNTRLTVVNHGSGHIKATSDYSGL